MGTPLDRRRGDVLLYSAGHIKHEWTSWAAMVMIFADMDQAMEGEGGNKNGNSESEDNNDNDRATRFGFADGRDGRFRSVSTVSDSDNLYSSHSQMAADQNYKRQAFHPQQQKQDSEVEGEGSPDLLKGGLDAIPDRNDDLGDFGDDFNMGDKSSQPLDPDTNQDTAEVQVEGQTEGISSNIIWCASLVLIMTMIRQGMTSNCHYRPSFVPLLQFHQLVMVMVLVRVSLIRLRLWIWPWPPRGMTE